MGERIGWLVPYIPLRRVENMVYWPLLMGRYLWAFNSLVISI
jgi:hypothetical protein